MLSAELVGQKSCELRGVGFAMQEEMLLVQQIGSSQFGDVAHVDNAVTEVLRNSEDVNGL